MAEPRRRRAAGLAAISAGLLAAPPASAQTVPFAVPTMPAQVAVPTMAAPVAAYAVRGDAIEAPLLGLAGDPARGRAIVADRRVGLCLLCHAGPFPEVPFQGDLAPDLAGVGARLGPGRIRLRIVDSRRLDPASIMPSYHHVEGTVRVADAFAGRPILDAQAVEDVVAFLVTLREPAG